MALYPSFKNSTSFDDLIKNDPTAAALFGVSGSLTSTAGWLNGNIYANLFPLVMLLLTIGYGAAAIAGQNEDGTLCLLLTLPRRRAEVLYEKVAAMALQAAFVSATVGACVLVGRSFDLTVTVGNVLAVSVAVCLLALDFGLVTMTVGALTGSRATALGAGTALAAVSYLIGSLAPVVSLIHPLRFISLFYWSVGDNQIGDGVSLADFAVLIAVGICGLYAALIAFRRLDIR